ncbi:hypothetical protein [Nostoc sp. UIC 10630]|uniref:hypothetical protein n=1 Tax=Nostoc sp. UIC 10630 TaxID=2100146 RepID=UPI0013D57160|nr:hypothetical protein [Nostoc sp. UIC 10630]NEU78339.1 hypothetical protein [Nostoc sp. UIC 10630]
MKGLDLAISVIEFKVRASCSLFPDAIAGRLTPQYNGQAIALSLTLEYYSQSCRDDWR